jgi:hypothetical protein
MFLFDASNSYAGIVAISVCTKNILIISAHVPYDGHDHALDDVVESLETLVISCLEKCRSYGVSKENVLLLGGSDLNQDMRKTEAVRCQVLNTFLASFDCQVVEPNDCELTSHCHWYHGSEGLPDWFFMSRG